MTQSITDINHIISSFIGWFVLIGFSRGTTIFITDFTRVFCASSVEIGLLYKREICDSEHIPGVQCC